MHLSPNLKAALWNARQYERDGQPQPPKRARGAEPAARPSRAARARPDYGCVEWYFYDERVERHHDV